jgi:hypothetical protein
MFILIFFYNIIDMLFQTIKKVFNKQKKIKDYSTVWYTYNVL